MLPAPSCISWLRFKGLSLRHFWWHTLMIYWFIVNMKHLIQTVSLKCSMSWDNKHYMLNLRSVISLLLKSSSLDMFPSKKESKLTSLRLKLSRVGPSQLLSWRSVAFMDWHLSIDGSLRILAPLWRQKLDGWKNWSFNIYIPQAQGLSSSTWGIVRKELGFKYRDSNRAIQSRPNERTKSRLN